MINYGEYIMAISRSKPKGIGVSWYKTRPNSKKKSKLSRLPRSSLVYNYNVYKPKDSILVGGIQPRDLEGK